MQPISRSGDLRPALPGQILGWDWKTSLIFLPGDPVTSCKCWWAVSMFSPCWSVQCRFLNYTPPWMSINKVLFSSALAALRVGSGARVVLQVCCSKLPRLHLLWTGHCQPPNPPDGSLRLHCTAPRRLHKVFGLAFHILLTVANCFSLPPPPPDTSSFLNAMRYVTCHGAQRYRHTPLLVLSRVVAALYNVFIVQDFILETVLLHPMQFMFKLKFKVLFLNSTLLSFAW